MNTRFARFLSLAALGLLLLAAPRAASAADDFDDVRGYIEILRSDLNAAKVRILDEALRLTEAEAEAFWPLYRRYEAEYTGITERRIEFTQEFLTFQNADAQDPERARRIAEKWFALQESRLALWKKYYGEMSKALSTVRAAQFVQVEHEIALYIDLSISSEAPLLGETGTAAAPEPEAGGETKPKGE